MLEARKENKVYKIDETQKKRYLNEGFDIYDENGVIVEHTPKKVIKYSEHLKKLEAVVAEKDAQIIALMEAKNEVEVNDVTVLLKDYADKKGVDLGSASTAKGILDKILDAEK